MFSSRENQWYYDFDVRFHTPESGWVQLICHVLLTHNYKTYNGKRSYSWTTDSLLDFCANKTASTDMNLLLFIVPWWNIKRCIQFRRNSNLQLSLLSFLLVGRDAIIYLANGFLASVWQEEGNFEVLRRCYIQIYPIIVFCCVREKLLFFNICETLSEVMRTSCKRSSGT